MGRVGSLGSLDFERSKKQRKLSSFSLGLSWILVELLARCDSFLPFLFISWSVSLFGIFGSNSELLLTVFEEIC